MRHWLLSLAALALIASPALAGKYNKVVSVGDKAPAIEGIPAVAGDKEVSLNLGDVKEDVVVVVFLANHCPVVKAVEDRLHDLVASYKGMNAAGGPKGVGDAVNESVVITFILLFVVNFVMSAIYFQLVPPKTG